MQYNLSFPFLALLFSDAPPSYHFSQQFFHSTMRIKDGDLIQAVQQGNFQFVLDFLNKKHYKPAKIQKYLNQVDSRSHLTILHNLVLHNPNSNSDSLPCKLLLKILASLQNPENSKSLVHAEDINGMTALHYAAFQGNHQYCSILLAYYTNVRQN